MSDAMAQAIDVMRQATERLTRWRSLLLEIHAYMAERADADYSDAAGRAVGNDAMHFKRWIEQEQGITEEV